MKASEQPLRLSSAESRTALSGSLLLTFRELWAMRLTQGIVLVSTLAWIMLSFALNLDVVEGSISALRIFGGFAPAGEPAPTLPSPHPRTGTL